MIYIQICFDQKQQQMLTAKFTKKKWKEKSNVESNSQLADIKGSVMLKKYFWHKDGKIVLKSDVFLQSNLNNFTNSW